MASEQVVDIFASAGLKNLDISILSNEFLEEVRGLTTRNLALELLRNLINDEIKTRSSRNLIQSRTGSRNAILRQFGVIKTVRSKLHK